MSIRSDAAVIIRGIRKLFYSNVDYRSKECLSLWDNSSLKPLVQSCCERVESSLANCISKRTQNSTETSDDSKEKVSKRYTASQCVSTTTGRRTYCTKTSSSRSDNTKQSLKNGLKNNATGTKLLPIADSFEAPDITKKAKESKVPGSRIGRITSFGGLCIRLVSGALSDKAMKGLGMKKTDAGTILGNNPFLTEAGAEDIVNTLCRVRGAALKLGQMLSIQDNSLISPSLQKIFERVRQSADFMPTSQMEDVLKRELGSDWRSKFLDFDMKPFAAASIGQVHKATLHDGRLVAVKIQYPGVADSINSDINNLTTLLKVSRILPEGLYANTALKVAKKELGWECDYVREGEASEKFKSFLKDDPFFYVPEVIWEMTTKEVLTTELVRGVSLDVLNNEDQQIRNDVCEKLLELCLNEVFTYRFMQTDPNWSNFLYDSETRTISLIDFGASRGFERRFTDLYVRLIMAASKGEHDKVLDMSRKMKFLTGYETKTMEKAHVDAVMILGEAFSSDEPFDFGAQSTARRIHELIPVMLKHRLTPPPEETYSLHRKMAGCFLLCSKLRANIICRPMFVRVYERYMKEVMGGAFPDD